MSEETYTMAEVDQAREHAAEKLRVRAKSVETVSWVLFGVFLLCFAIAGTKELEGDDPFTSQHEGPRAALLWAAVCFCLGCWTNLIAHLIHIRASLERRS